jgi:CheY-like chemotaxis protein
MRISFDPRVWVLEYERTPEEIERTWFTPEELDQFRKQTIARLIAHNTELLPTGTGFVVQRGKISTTKAVFAMPAMSADGDDDDTDENDVVNAVNSEIQNILVVDPHDICSKLFSRDLKRMIPNINVCACSSSEEARKRMTNTRFDIVIVEERLKVFHRRCASDQWATQQEDEGHSSGSEFIKVLAHEKLSGPPEDKCLFIAVSAHLDKDKEKMQKNGADFLWAKPPPKMDEIVRDVLLKGLLVKREKQELADRLFGEIMGIP